MLIQLYDYDISHIQVIVYIICCGFRTLLKQRTISHYFQYDSYIFEGLCVFLVIRLEHLPSN